MSAIGDHRGVGASYRVNLFPRQTTANVLAV